MLNIIDYVKIAAEEKHIIAVPYIGTCSANHSYVWTFEVTGVASIPSDPLDIYVTNVDCDEYFSFIFLYTGIK